MCYYFKIPLAFPLGVNDTVPVSHNVKYRSSWEDGEGTRRAESIWVIYNFTMFLADKAVDKGII